MTGARGFTLIEMVAATAGLAVVFVASLALLSIIASAMPNRASASTPAAVVPAVGAFEALCVDLADAAEFENRDANGFRFRVPDRDGDETDEWFVFDWSGTPGDPLTLARNGFSGLPHIANVHALSVSIETFDATPAAVSYEELSNPRVIDGVGAMPGSHYDTTLTNPTAFHVRPNLSRDATRWSVDQIRVWIAGIRAGQSLTIELVEEELLGHPTGRVIETWTIENTALSDAWFVCTGRNTEEFAPDAELAVRMTPGDAANPPSIRMSLGQSGQWMTYQSLGTWLLQPGVQPTLGVIGRDTTPGMTSPEPRAAIEAVTLTLQVGEAGATRTLTRRVLLTKRPEVAP